MSLQETLIENTEPIEDTGNIFTIVKLTDELQRLSAKLCNIFYALETTALQKESVKIIGRNLTEDELSKATQEIYDGLGVYLDAVVQAAINKAIQS